MASYNPLDWYWLADDSRVFASARQAVVTDSDADYMAWLDAGNSPTPWPRDEAGEQTLAEMQRVMAPYVIAVDLKAYNFMMRDQKEHDGCSITGVSGITEIRTDDYTQKLVSRYHEAAASNPAFTMPWILPDRSTITLDKAAIDALFDQTTAFIVGTYNTYSQVTGGIDSGTITTIGEIDAAYGGGALRRGKTVDIGWQS